MAQEQNKSQLEIQIRLDASNIDQDVVTAQQQIEQAAQKIQQAFGKSQQQQSFGDLGFGGGGSGPNSAPSLDQYPVAPGAGQPSTINDLQQRFAQIQGSAFGGGFFGLGQFPQTPLASTAALSQLQNQAVRGAGSAPPEELRTYENLIQEIRKLQNELAKNSEAVSRSDPASATLRFLQTNALARGVGDVFSDLQSNNVLGAGGTIAGTAFGAGLGLLNLPFSGAAGIFMGGRAGGILGRIAGSAAQGVVSAAGEAREFEYQATDLAARFQDFGAIGALKRFDQTEFGYSPQEYLSQVDALRQSNLIDSVGEAQPVVREIQRLSRALGENTQELISTAAAYRQSTGRSDITKHIGQVVEGAVASGFETRINQFADILSSAQMQSVYSLGQRSSGNIIGLAAGLFGGTGTTARLYQDNPSLATQALTESLQLGGVDNIFGLRAGYLRMAGVREEDLSNLVVDDEQRIANTSTLINQVAIPQISNITGLSRDELQRRAQADPDFFKNLLRDNAALQQYLLLAPAAPFANSSPTQVRALEQLINASLANNGNLTPAMIAGSPELQRVAQQATQTEAASDRARQAEVQSETLRILEKFEGVLDSTEQFQLDLLKKIDENFNLRDAADKTEKFVEWMTEKLPPTLDAIADGMKLIDQIKSSVETAGGAIIRASADVLKNVEGIVTGIRNSPLGRLMGADAIGSAGARSAIAPDGTYQGPAAIRIPADPDGFNAYAVEETRRGREQVMNSLSGIKKAFGSIGFSASPDPGDMQIINDERMRSLNLYQDTPPGGVVVQPGGEVMRFAVGDRVVAKSSLNDDAVNRYFETLITSGYAQEGLLGQQRQFLERIFNTSELQHDTLREISGRLGEFRGQTDSQLETLNTVAEAIASEVGSLSMKLQSAFVGRGGMTGGGSISEALFSAIIGQESGGKNVVNKDSGAFGISQIMPQNITGEWGNWDREALGRDVSLAELKASPELQEQITRFKLEQYFQEELENAGGDLDTAVRRTAARWYSPSADLYNSTRPQGNYPSIRDYTYQVLERFKDAYRPPAPSGDRLPIPRGAGSPPVGVPGAVPPPPPSGQDLPPLPVPMSQGGGGQQVVYNVTINQQIPDGETSDRYEYVRAATRQGVKDALDAIPNNGQVNYSMTAHG